MKKNSHGKKRRKKKFTVTESEAAKLGVKKDRANKKRKTKSNEFVTGRS